MIDPATAFSLSGLLAMLGWAGLLLALFVKPARTYAWTAAAIVIPALLGVAYILLIQEGMRAVEGGGFGSIDEVRALFANDAALAAGWLHYLAFDLFVGAWIAREGPALGRPRSAADPLPRPHLPVRPGRPVALPHPPLRLQPPHRAGDQLMASLASPRALWPLVPAPRRASRLRQRTLALYGHRPADHRAFRWSSLQLVDPRTLHGVNVWVKPVKFLVSVGVFSLTAAWFFGYIRPERRRVAPNARDRLDADRDGQLRARLDRLAGEPGPRLRTSTPAPLSSRSCTR